MRLISGKFRGRKLVNSDHLKSVRPTTDKNREALFNILSFGKFGFHLVGAEILDLCCGTGAVGFEALSRGAKFVTFLDNNREHLELVKKNSQLLKVEKECEIICADARSLPSSLKSERLRGSQEFERKTKEILDPSGIKDDAGGGFDLIFLDPPYSEDCSPIIQDLLQKNFLTEKTLLVVEIKSVKELPDFSPLQLLEERKYGSTTFVFLKKC